MKTTRERTPTPDSEEMPVGQHFREVPDETVDQQVARMRAVIAYLRGDR